MPLALRRIRLADQVADALRVELDAARWATQLPGEHQLAATLQVSRSTLRQALQLLHREGRLAVRRGSRWRPVPAGRGVHRAGRDRGARVPDSPPPSSSAPSPARTGPRASGSAAEVVAMISSVPTAEQSWSSILIRDELRAQLQRAGLELQTHVLAQRSPRSGGGALRRLLAHTGAAAWVLASCSEAVQRHFEGSGQPALVLGSAHPGVRLPAFRIDLGAALRHALGTLHRHGHRRLALLLPRTPFAGTREVAASLADATPWLRERGMAVTVREHESSTSGVGSAVSGLLASQARPTALVAMLPGDALSALGHLHARGVRVPAALSLVCLFDDPYLARLTPAPARYACDPAVFVRRLARQLVRLVHSGVRPASVAVVPEFIRGGTLQPPPGTSAH
jgi:DNA-binding LacI/PurR family transcriptional regulator